jgi:23S rRNA (pseudouridine1915-N3)-methyltransferase
MEVWLSVVGRLKSGPESEICERYLDRTRKVGKRLGFQTFGVRETAESRAARASDRLAQEESTLLSGLAAGDRVTCLDAKGDLIDSGAFAGTLASDAASGTARAVFVIGGPDGLGAKILRMADRRLSFGRMTLPHQLVRVLLAEQLYRAMAILSGHPYHRA